MSGSKFKTGIHEKVELARNGLNSFVICKLESCWVIARETQPIDGCCVILSDPVVGSINELNESDRMIYCRDMVRVGDALLKVMGAYRVNYETWCNLDQALHTHVVPRYLDEPDAKRTKPACVAYDFDTARKFDPLKDSSFVQKMRLELGRFATDRNVISSDGQND